MYFYKYRHNHFFIFRDTRKYGFRSKCDNIELCYGLIKVHRRVELESSDDDNQEEKRKWCIKLI